MRGDKLLLCFINGCVIVELLKNYHKLSLPSLFWWLTPNVNSLSKWYFVYYEQAYIANKFDVESFNNRILHNMNIRNKNFLYLFPPVNLR